MTAPKTVKSLALRTVRVDRMTNFHIYADLKCHLLARYETRMQLSARYSAENPFRHLYTFVMTINAQNYVQQVNITAAEKNETSQTVVNNWRMTWSKVVLV